MSDQWVELSDMLIEKTKSGKLKWDLTTFSNGFEEIPQLNTKVGGHRIELSKLPTAYSVSIFDELDDEIDTFSDDDLTMLGYPGYFGEFDAIYRLAKREAKGATKIVADIIDELKR